MGAFFLSFAVNDQWRALSGGCTEFLPSFFFFLPSFPLTTALAWRTGALLFCSPGDGTGSQFFTAERQKRRRRRRRRRRDAARSITSASRQLRGKAPPVLRGRGPGTEIVALDRIVGGQGYRVFTELLLPSSST